MTKTVDKKTGKTQYCTYLPNEKKGKRTYKRRQTRKELEDLLVAFYKEQEEKIYLSTVYYEWIENKLNYGDIKQETYDRYNDNFERFFVNYKHPITQKQFKYITEDDIEDYIKSVIRDLELTHKAYEGCRTLIRGIFRLAKKKKYTDISITHFFGDLELSRNIFKRKIVDNEKEIFNEDEIIQVTKYLSDHDDIYNLGVLLVFYTGLRVGELSALKSSDIKGQVIQIKRTEVKYRDENQKWKVEVRDDTKTEAGNRALIIPTHAKTILDKIIALNPNGEYFFENGGKRIRGNTFNKRLAIVCDKLNISRRSIHKIRKTYATTLIDNNVSESFIKEQMGHSDISTTRKLYYLSNKSKQTKLEQIEKAVSF
ncbi:MAG: site-specific integrase [Lachnospiraceae bacterium]|nr:site-specific integrase [Tyzzerella sp.]MBQ6993945.1 site-specific integrase [Lachnospiraceae bacterium]